MSGWACILTQFIEAHSPQAKVISVYHYPDVDSRYWFLVGGGKLYYRVLVDQHGCLTHGSKPISPYELLTSLHTDLALGFLCRVRLV
jgi:hypothetical protein